VGPCQYGEEPDPIARLAQGRQGPRSGLARPCRLSRPVQLPGLLVRARPQRLQLCAKRLSLAPLIVSLE